MATLTKRMPTATIVIPESEAERINNQKPNLEMKRMILERGKRFKENRSILIKGRKTR